MPYRGRPSKGCQACRSMKIRCGEQRPSCIQCFKGNRPCPGYRDQLDLMFVDESAKVGTKVRRKLQHSPTPVTSTYPLGYYQELLVVSPGLELVPAVGDQALSFFFYNYSDFNAQNTPKRITETLYLQDSDTGPVRTAVQAVGLAGLSNVAKDHRARTEAFANYGRAILKVNEALGDPSQQKSDGVLYAILMLGLFETVTYCTTKSILSWGEHIRGAATLLEIRGAEQLKTETGMFVFLQLRSQIIINCCVHNLPLPPVITQWADQIITNLPHRRESRFLVDSSIKIVDTRAVFRATTPLDSETLSTCLATCLSVEKDLQRWPSIAPLSWQSIKPPTNATKDIPKGPGYLVYNSDWIAGVWCNYRSIHMLTHETIIEILAHSPEDHSAQISHFLSKTARLTSELMQTIAFLLRPSPTGSPPPLSAGLICIWPLYVIGSAPNAHDSALAWAIRQLLHIGYTMGIAQALAMASVLRTRDDLTVWQGSLALRVKEAPDTGKSLPLWDDVAGGSTGVLDDGSEPWRMNSDWIDDELKDGDGGR